MYAIDAITTIVMAGYHEPLVVPFIVGIVAFIVGVVATVITRGGPRMFVTLGAVATVQTSHTV